MQNTILECHRAWRAIICGQVSDNRPFFWLTSRSGPRTGYEVQSSADKTMYSVLQN